MPFLIFDCDGVLADTERNGHLPAFNRTFEEFGVPVQWSDADYAVKVLIGGGKERMASLLTPEFVAANGLPADEEGQRELLAQWHRRKTAIYTDLVESGALPARPGIARIAGEADAAGWGLAVASTSAEASVRAVLEHAVGDALATRFSVFAGDIVEHKKPAPDIYLLALDELGAGDDEAVVIEDSGNGVQAAVAAGLRTLVTVSSYTADEDFAGASLVVSSLGDADELGPSHRGSAGRVARPETRPRRPRADPPPRPTPDQQGGLMTRSNDAEFVVRTIAQTAVDNEKYFGDLDSVVGDGDFGYSLARGFEIVLKDWDGYDRSDIGTFLQKIGVAISSRIGGTSGPIWGTGFLRAAGVAKGKEELSGADAVSMLRASIAGIMARGNAELGDKTLLDALSPMTDSIEAALAAGEDSDAIVAGAATTARRAAEATTPMIAKRGRAAYTGERSIGSPDAGAVAIAVIAEAIAAGWPTRGENA